MLTLCSLWTSGALLSSWLSSDGLLKGEQPIAAGFDDRVLLTPASNASFIVTASRNFEEGEMLFELREGALLTARAAYTDKEIGKDLVDYANRIGPGFDAVALSTFIAAERARGFKSESVGRFSALGAPPRLSPWSPLTKALWARAVSNPSVAIDPDLDPIVQQGVELALPLVDRVARRAWTVGPGSPAGGTSQKAPPIFSEEWVRSAALDDSEGFSEGELRDMLRDAFSLVLNQAADEPPAYLGTSERAERWGWMDDAPEGRALLLPLLGVLVEQPGGEAEESNAVWGVPLRPENGNAGAGVCLRCVARKPIAGGESVRA